MEAELGSSGLAVIAPVDDPVQESGSAAVVVQQQLHGLAAESLHLWSTRTGSSGHCRQHPHGQPTLASPQFSMLSSQR